MLGLQGQALAGKATLVTQAAATAVVLTNQIPVQQRKLSDANLYRRDPPAFKLASDALADAQAKLAAAEERWLELEMQREALNG